MWHTKEPQLSEAPANETLRLWDLSDGRCLVRSIQRGGAVTFVALSADFVVALGEPRGEDSRGCGIRP